LSATITFYTPHQASLWQVRAAAVVFPWGETRCGTVKGECAIFAQSGNFFMSVKYAFALSIAMISGIFFMGLGLATVDAGVKGESIVDGYAVQSTKQALR
jgi:hypothetical protein